MSRITSKQVIIPPEYRNPAFRVNAGKYEHDYERNSKYCDSFATMQEALEAWEKVIDYPWAVIEYVAPDGRIFEITPQPILED